MRRKNAKKIRVTKNEVMTNVKEEKKNENKSTYFQNREKH